MIDYILIRSKRKTIALYVRDGGVEVRAPLKMPKQDIDRFVASKEKWVMDRLVKSQDQSVRREAFSLGYGDTVLYRGKQYPITAKAGSRVGFDNACFYMPPNLPPEQIKAACVQIYRLLAKRDLTEKTLYFARRMGVTPSAFKINGAKTRWGSCSAKKSINYSWRLIMADDAVIDYVVVHELAHLTELNHSARFWTIVKKTLPDYRERQKCLRELQQRLTDEAWED